MEAVIFVRDSSGTVAEYNFKIASHFRSLLVRTRKISVRDTFLLLLMATMYFEKNIHYISSSTRSIL